MWKVKKKRVKKHRQRDRKVYYKTTTNRGDKDDYDSENSFSQMEKDRLAYRLVQQA